MIEDQDPKVVEKPSPDPYRVGQVDESLWEALDSLSEIYREVILLHYFGGMTIKNIARAIGVSPSAIGMRLNRARAQLKEEMIAMMDTAFEGHKLQASFTFRIVEAVKRIKINPMPRSAGLPWGLSLAAGVMLVAMTIGSQLAIRQQSEPLVLSREMNVPEVREIAVDILGAPGTSGMAGRQGDTDGGGMDPRNPQNTFLLAPGKGGGTWTRKADMPTARYIPGSAVVDGKIYVIGGAPFPLGGTTVVEEYDPAADTWTRRADMPTARQGVRAAAVDGIIYAFGGRTKRLDPASDVPTVEIYDPATDTWTQASDMPRSRCFHTASVVDGNMYIIGGASGTPGAGVYMSPVVDVYDPGTDTWTTAADLPTPRWNSTANVVDGKIYTIGGEVGEEAAHPIRSPVSTLEEFDPGLTDNISVTNPAGKLLRTWGEVKSE